MLRRVRKGVSPFKPDRDHLHHIFMRAGFSSRATLGFITCMAFFLSLIAVWATILNIPEWLQLIAFLLLFFVYKYSLAHIWKLLSFHHKMKIYRDHAISKVFKNK